MRMDNSTGDVVLRVVFQSPHEHVPREVPFNLSEHVREINRAEIAAMGEDGEAKPSSNILRR